MGRGSGDLQRGRSERDDTADDSEDEEDEEEERKENRPQQRARRGKEQSQSEDEDDNDDDSDEGEQKNGDGERTDEEEDNDNEEEEEETSSGRRSGPPSTAMLLGEEARKQNSCLTVKLQPAARGHRDPNAIVPKLEAAITPRSPPTAQPRDSLLRQPLRNGASHASTHPATAASRTARSDKPLATSVARNGRGLSHSARGSRGHSQTRIHSSNNTSSSSSSSSLSSLHPSARDGGSGPGCEKEVWVSVFRYLSQAELCVCMAVCKSWYKW